MTMNLLAVHGRIRAFGQGAGCWQRVRHQTFTGIGVAMGEAMTPSRVSAQRLGREFPTVSLFVIEAAVVQARAELHPNLADSLSEMTELLAHERIRRIAASRDGRPR
ncbi:hypothetical protein [Nocardia sp. NPDC050175]|uniref:hypothetical protein n=1 Tax=Nocardia sp. NPDC050175 TaxID=3364317 RepID=UPI00378CF723